MGITAVISFLLASSSPQPLLHTAVGGALPKCTFDHVAFPLRILYCLSGAFRVKSNFWVSQVYPSVIWPLLTSEVHLNLWFMFTGPGTAMFLPLEISSSSFSSHPLLVIKKVSLPLGSIPQSLKTVGLLLSVLIAPQVYTCWTQNCWNGLWTHLFPSLDSNFSVNFSMSSYMWENICWMNKSK